MVKLLTEIAQEVKEPMYDSLKDAPYKPKYDMNELKKLADKYLSNCHSSCNSCVIGIG